MKKERGIALILVMFIVALATILVVHLTQATFLASRANAYVEKSVEAEYLLRSAVNFARALIKNDSTPEESNKDSWGVFSNGLILPLSTIGVNKTEPRMTLQIRPVEAKIPLNQLGLNGNPSSIEKEWRQVLVRLFQGLGFDRDAEEDDSGFFPGRVFSGPEMVSNLIDYMDADSESLNDEALPPGIEKEVPEGRFPNREMKSLSEIGRVPGFTKLRVQKILPYVTQRGSRLVNINVAPEKVLRALSEAIGDKEVERIVQFRDGAEGPFTDSTRQTVLQDILGATVGGEVLRLTTVDANQFEVIVKVEYSSGSYFAQSFLAKARGLFPDIVSFEMF